MTLLKKQLQFQMDQKGISAAQLSRKTGIPKQTLSDWLAGAQPRKIELLKKVADEFGVTITELCFGAAGTNEPHSKSLDRWYEKMSQGDFFTEILPEESKLKMKNNSSAYPFSGDQQKYMEMAAGYAFKHVRCLVTVVGYNGVVLASSAPWRTYMGYKKGIEGVAFFELMPATDQPLITKACEKNVMDLSESVTHTHRFLKEDGTKVEVQTTTALDPTNQVAFHVSILKP